jgi:glutamyl-Q tRNA(Asp) synthetase
MEDIDTTRCKPEYEACIVEDLAWLGVTWDDVVLRQSEHFVDYRAAVAQLERSGLTYRCYASRTEITAAVRGDRRDPDGAPLYPGRDVVLSPREQEARWRRGEPFAVRLDMDRAVVTLCEKRGTSQLTFTSSTNDGALEVVAADPTRWGDAILLRKEVPASYHIAVVVDDARQGVTHVSRGEDLLAATDLQRLLQELLGLPAPHYHHHRLVRDANGRKLSKSDGDISLRALRAQGFTPADVRRMIGLPHDAVLTRG